MDRVSPYEVIRILITNHPALVVYPSQIQFLCSKSIHALNEYFYYPFLIYWQRDTIPRLAINSLIEMILSLLFFSFLSNKSEYIEKGKKNKTKQKQKTNSRARGKAVLVNTSRPLYKVITLALSLESCIIKDIRASLWIHRGRIHSKGFIHIDNKLQKAYMLHALASLKPQKCVGHCLCDVSVFK